jgi:hypothetical protein
VTVKTTFTSLTVLTIVGSELSTSSPFVSGVGAGGDAGVEGSVLSALAVCGFAAGLVFGAADVAGGSGLLSGSADGICDRSWYFPELGFATGCCAGAVGAAWLCCACEGACGNDASSCANAGNANIAASTTIEALRDRMMLCTYYS